MILGYQKRHVLELIDAFIEWGRLERRVSGQDAWRCGRRHRLPMNQPSEVAILEKLRALSPERIAEVEDFVDFLRTREEEARDAAAKRLGEAMRKLAALDLPPMTEEEVQAEIDAARRERRERLGAHRR